MGTNPAYGTTKVPVSQSISATEGLLIKRGISDIRWTRTSALIALEFNYPKRQRQAGGSSKITAVLGIRIVAPWNADEKEQRRVARVLYWHLKSKLEVVDAGVLSMEEEFLAHLTLGRGRRVWDDFKPRLEAAIAKGEDLSEAMGEAITQSTKALPSPHS